MKMWTILGITLVAAFAALLIWTAHDAGRF